MAKHSGPLLRPKIEDEDSRAARKQRDALAAARAAGVLSQDEYESKRAAWPSPAAGPERRWRRRARLLVVLVPLTALLQ